MCSISVRSAPFFPFPDNMGGWLEAGIMAGRGIRGSDKGWVWLFESMCGKHGIILNTCCEADIAHVHILCRIFKCSGDSASRLPLYYS